MTYRQLLDALERAQQLKTWIDEIPFRQEDKQRAYSTEDLAEVRRLEAQLDEEITP